MGIHAKDPQLLRPVSVGPQIERVLSEFCTAPGAVLDWNWSGLVPTVLLEHPSPLTGSGLVLIPPFAHSIRRRRTTYPEADLERPFAKRWIRLPHLLQRTDHSCRAGKLVES